MAQSVGAAGAGNIYSSLYDVDFEDRTSFLVGEEGKFTKFMGTLPAGDKVRARYVDWPYSEVTSPIDTVTAIVSDVSLVFPVTNIDQWKPYCLVRLPNGETCLIDSVDRNASTFTVFSRARGGNVAAAALAASDQIIRMGTAMPDNASVSEARMQVDVSARNYVQTFYENVDFDLTTLAINENNGFHGGDFEARKRKEAFLKYMWDQDTAHLFGVGAEVDGARSMGGIGNFVASTETGTIAALTELQLDTFLETKGMLHGADNKLLIAGSTIIGGINRYAKGRMQTKSGTGQRYGYDMRFYDGPMGALKVMPHYLMSLSTDLKKVALLIDTSDIRARVLIRSKLHVDIDVGTRLGKMDMWHTQRTAAWGHPRHHARINGVTSFT